VNQYENSQRLNQLRRAYHRCLQAHAAPCTLRSVYPARSAPAAPSPLTMRRAPQVPMHSVERFWAEYEAWERGLDPNNTSYADGVVKDMDVRPPAPPAAPWIRAPTQPEIPARETLRR